MTPGTNAFSGSGLLRNSLVAIAVKIISPASMLVSITAIAHYRSPAVLGEYTFLVLLVQLAELLKCLGLNALVTRETAKAPDDALSWWRSLVRIGNWGTAFSAPILLLAIAVSSGGHLTSNVILSCIVLLPGLWASSYSIANEAVFFGLGRVSYLAVVTLGECFTRAALSIFALFVLHISVIGLVCIYSLTRVLSAVIGRVLRRKLSLIDYGYDRTFTRRLLSNFVPFLAVFVFPLILFRIDVLALGLTGNALEVGTYSAASRLFTLALLIPDATMTTLFAGYSHAAAISSARFQSLVLKSCSAVVAVGTLIGIVSYFAAPIAIGILFGKQFTESLSLFRLLIWALPLFAFSRSVGDALVALNRQTVTASVVVVTTFTSVAFYGALVPTFHGKGAAMGFLCSAAALTLLSGIAFSRVEKMSLFALWSPLIPAVAASIGVFVLSNKSVIAVLLGVGAAFSLLIVFLIMRNDRNSSNHTYVAEAERISQWTCQ